MDHDTGHAAGNFRQAELDRFGALAQRWWDPQGPQKPLHALNPTRLGYVTARVPLQDARVLDVGCGAGLLSEALAQAGAAVTAIDLAPDLLKIARLSMAGPSWHPFWATSAAASALASAASSTCSPQPHRLPHSLSAVPKPAKSRKTHSAQTVARGFGLPGLSGAYRQPKLFTKAVWQLLIPICGKWTLASAIPF